LVLISIINNIPKGVMDFVFLEESYTKTAVYYMLEGFTVTENTSGVKVIECTLNAAVVEPGKGFKKDDSFTSAIDEDIYNIILEMAIKLHSESYVRSSNFEIH